MAAYRKPGASSRMRPAEFKKYIDIMKYINQI